jgi:hypothetical protein
MVVLAGAGTAYRFRPRRATSEATTVAPTFAFTSRWDAGTFQLEPAGALGSGPGLRLESGIEMGIPQLSSEQLVKSVVEEDARR